MSEEAPLWQKVGLAVDSALHTLVAPEPEPPAEKTYRLGILFVHGMGQQERGDTITQMGDALTEWLRRWLGNGTGSAERRNTAPGSSDRRSTWRSINGVLPRRAGRR